MPTRAVSITVAVCLGLGALGRAGAMTPEDRKRFLELTADLATMSSRLPALASGGPEDGRAHPGPGSVRQPPLAAGGRAHRGRAPERRGGRRLAADAAAQAVRGGNREPGDPAVHAAGPRRRALRDPEADPFHLAGQRGSGRLPRQHRGGRGAQPGLPGPGLAGRPVPRQRRELPGIALPGPARGPGPGPCRGHGGSPGHLPARRLAGRIPAQLRGGLGHPAAAHPVRRRRDLPGHRHRRGGAGGGLAASGR